MHGPGIASRVSVACTRAHVQDHPTEPASPNKLGARTPAMRHVTGVTWPVVITMTAWTLTHNEPRHHPRRAPMPHPRIPWHMPQATWGHATPHAHALRLSSGHHPSSSPVLALVDAPRLLFTCPGSYSHAPALIHVPRHLFTCPGTYSRALALIHPPRLLFTHPGSYSRTLALIHTPRLLFTHPGSYSCTPTCSGPQQHVPRTVQTRLTHLRHFRHVHAGFVHATSTAPHPSAPCPGCA